VALGFIFDNEIFALATGKLATSRLLGIEMIKTRFAGNNLSVFCQL
jgi:hypothetical protein